MNRDVPNAILALVSRQLTGEAAIRGFGRTVPGPVLGVALLAEAEQVRRRQLPVIAAVIAGAVTAIVTAMGVAWALGASRTTLLSLAPKSVMTPIARAIAERVGLPDWLRCW